MPFTIVSQESAMRAANSRCPCSPMLRGKHSGWRNRMERKQPSKLEGFFYTLGVLGFLVGLLHFAAWGAGAFD